MSFSDIQKFESINRITDPKKGKEEQIKDIILALGITLYSKQLIEFIRSNDDDYIEEVDMRDICEHIPSPIPQTTPSPFHINNESSFNDMQIGKFPSNFDWKTNEKQNEKHKCMCPRPQILTPPLKRKKINLTLKGDPTLHRSRCKVNSRLRKLIHIVDLDNNAFSYNEDSILITEARLPRLFTNKSQFAEIFGNSTRFSVFYDSTYNFYQIVGSDDYFRAIKQGNMETPVVSTIAYKNIQLCRNCSKQYLSLTNECYTECSYMHQHEHFQSLNPNCNIACRIFDEKKKVKQWICDIPVITLERSIN